MDIIIPQKQCRDCKQFKPATTEFFNKTALYQSPDGLNKQCKDCRKAHRKALYQSTPKVPRPKGEYKLCPSCKNKYPATFEYFCFNGGNADRLHYECKECGKKRCEAYRLSPEGIQYRQDYWETHREEGKLYSRNYHATHKEQERQYRKRTAPAHKAYWQEYHKAYYQSEQRRDARRVRTLNRIALRNATPGTHTAKEIREQYERQKGRCYYCQQKVKWGKHHVDHTFPLSREYARNSIDHLVITCEPCNLSKGNKYPWEWPEGGRLL